jgi:hypothetical protein
MDSSSFGQAICRNNLKNMCSFLDGQLIYFGTKGVADMCSFFRWSAHLLGKLYVKTT